MIANPAIPHPEGVPHPFALNDLRVHYPVSAMPSSSSQLILSGLIVAVVLAIGAFIWLGPLHLFTPTEANPPASEFVPTAETAQPTERGELIAPLGPASATKSVEVPVAPAPMVRVPQVATPADRTGAASIKPESRDSPLDKTNATVPHVSPKEKTAQPVLPNTPEEKAAPAALPIKQDERTDAPIVLKLGDNPEGAGKSADTNDQKPLPE